MLLFVNKTKADMILEDELAVLRGAAFENILSDEQIAGYEHGMITRKFLAEYVTDFTQQFYICGPPLMIASVESELKNLGVAKHNITKESL